jgi:hypothetical protein
MKTSRSSARSLLLLGLLLTACAPGPNPERDKPDDQGEVAGFWRGLWHGSISPVTFVVSLFSPNVRLYEVHNSGGWYDFGFLLGASCSLGGAAGGSARCGKRRSAKA